MKFQVSKTSMRGQSILQQVPLELAGINVQLPTDVANLFAAAPELVEAIKYTLNVLDPDGYEDVASRLKKALARVEGVK